MHLLLDPPDDKMLNKYYIMNFVKKRSHYADQVNFVVKAIFRYACQLSNLQVENFDQHPA